MIYFLFIMLSLLQETTGLGITVVFVFLCVFFTLSSKHGKMGKMCQLSLIFLSEGGL